MTPRPFAAACTVLFLAGCTLEGAPPDPAPAEDRTPIMPAPDADSAQSAQISESSTQTTTTVEGNTRRTETTSTSVSVDAGGLLDALAGGGQDAPQQPTNTAADYVGTWRVTSAENDACRLILTRPNTQGAPAQVRNRGCFGDLFGVSGWSLRGDTLVLTDPTGDRMAALRATARDRLDGDGVTMWR